MANELMVRPVTDMVANQASELPALQAPLAGWAKEKLESARAEYAELDEAAIKAKKSKWNPHVIRRAANRALKQISFYEKVVAALEAGFVLFPPVPNADCIAVRVGVGVTNFVDDTRHTRDWNNNPGGEVAPDVLPANQGKYVSPLVRWTLLNRYEDDKKDKFKEWQSLDLEDPAFPLAMAKPSIIDATTAAMEMKVFDEIRMFPFERRGKGDPCILGSIAMKTGKHIDRRLYFLISWRINKEDI